jgi:hypothetical protein
VGDNYIGATRQTKHKSWCKNVWDGLGQNGTPRTNQGFGHWHKGSISYAKGHFGTTGLELEVSGIVPRLTPLDEARNGTEVGTVH